MRPCHSQLFVPGNKPDWMEKVVKYKADVLILDLEDSVPYKEKVMSRPLVKAALKYLDEKGQFCHVRINGLATGLTHDDLEGVMCRDLKCITLPKVETVDDMKALDSFLAQLEK